MIGQFDRLTPTAEKHEQLNALNRTWLMVNALIQIYGKDSVIAVETSRIQNAVERIENELGGD